MLSVEGMYGTLRAVNAMFMRIFLSETFKEVLCIATGFACVNVVFEPVICWKPTTTYFLFIMYFF